MLTAPFVGNAAANFAAENIEIELEIGAFVIQARQIDHDRLKIEPAREIHSTNSEPVFLPFGRAAELRKRLPDRGRSDRHLAGRKFPGFDLISGNGGVAQNDNSRTVLDPQIEMSDVEIDGQQFLQG